MIYDLDNEYGAQIIGDGGESSTGTFQVQSGAAATPAVYISRSANGSPTVAPLRIAGTSAASAALIGFGGGFISLTSVIFTSAAHFDYAIPVEVGNVQRYIPLVAETGLSGGAAF